MNHWNIASAGLARKVVDNWPDLSMPVHTAQNKYHATVRLCEQHGELTGGSVVSVRYFADPSYTYTHKQIEVTRRLSAAVTTKSKEHAIFLVTSSPGVGSVAMGAALDLDRKFSDNIIPSKLATRY